MPSSTAWISCSRGDLLLGVQLEEGTDEVSTHDRLLVCACSIPVGRQKETWGSPTSRSGRSVPRSIHPARGSALKRRGDSDRRRRWTAGRSGHRSRRCSARDRPWAVRRPRRSHPSMERASNVSEAVRRRSLAPVPDGPALGPGVRGEPTAGYAARRSPRGSR